MAASIGSIRERSHMKTEKKSARSDSIQVTMILLSFRTLPKPYSNPIQDFTESGGVKLDQSKVFMVG
jgi:hypothetical protein